LGFAAGLAFVGGATFPGALPSFGNAQKLALYFLVSG
jgi:hypothetical protein